MTCTCKYYHQIGVYVRECTHICCANIVLAALFRNGNPQSGTVLYIITTVISGMHAIAMQSYMKQRVLMA